MEERRLVRINVVPQHPKTTPPVPVLVRRPVLDGPLGNRLTVFDYNRNADTVYPPARANDEGRFDHIDDPDNVHFHQLNAFAIAARAIGFVEEELGRNLDWGFDASRLILLPHAGEMANAFYSKATTSLQFYSYHVAGGVQHTCLLHDIVAHETGHALLDAVRNRYTAGHHPETAALHEGFADLAAVFAALSYRDLREGVLLTGDRDEANFENEFKDENEIADIADGFYGDSEELDGQGALRDLARADELQFEDIVEPHILSLQMTRGVFAALERFYVLGRHSGDGRQKALQIAHRALQRMVIRGLDYLPPADATFQDFARAVLAADASANPSDQRGYRAAMADLFLGAGIGARRADIWPEKPDDRPWSHEDLPWPPHTAAEAYLFLDQHRNRLELGDHPQQRDFVVRRFDVTRQPAERAHRSADSDPKEQDEIDNVVIAYEYPIDIELKGGETGSLSGRWLTIRGGGTLVFDAAGRLRHHARKPMSDERKRRTLDFVTALLGGRLGSVHPAGHAPPLDGYSPYEITFDDTAVGLGFNAAAGCGRRMPRREP